MGIGEEDEERWTNSSVEGGIESGNEELSKKKKESGNEAGSI
jgi:hypothetical protein